MSCSDRSRAPRWTGALFPLALLGAVLPAGATEVVVFRDQRSLVVQSHRVSTTWTYLAVEGGEIAVPTRLIAEIRNEGGDVGRASASVIAPPAPPSRPPEEPSRPAPDGEEAAAPPDGATPEPSAPPPSAPRPPIPPLLLKTRGGADQASPGPPPGLSKDLPRLPR